MIEVKCLASGSTGNSYAVDDGKTVLLLEAGIQSKKIYCGYADRLERVKGCLITHEHMDHAKGALRLAEAGIDVYASAGTLLAILPDTFRRGYRFHAIQAGTQLRLGSWIILPWEAQHDAAEPLGFLLYSTYTHERLLFATDTYFIPNTFPGLNYILLECNYDLDLLLENIQQGVVPESLKPRLLQSHFSIENAKTFLLANDLSSVRQIYLLHVSGQNGDKLRFHDEIVALTGIPVTVF